MTEQTNKTTRAPRAKKVTAPEVDVTKEDVIETTVDIDTTLAPVEPKVTKRELTDTTKVVIMNNTMGVYGYNQGNKAFTLAEYGQTAKVLYEDLQALARSSRSRRDITDAFIIILDEDVVEDMNLTSLYKHILDPKGIDALFKNPDRLEEVLPKMPKIMQETVIIQARQRFKTQDASRQLRDIRIVQTIKNVTDFDILE